MAAILALFFDPDVGPDAELLLAEHNPELAQLSQWARTATRAKTPCFLFRTPTQALYPGIFRADAARAVYASTGKPVVVGQLLQRPGGGMVVTLAENHGRAFDPKDVERYRGIGIDYIVLQAKNRRVGVKPVFERSFRRVSH